MVSNTIIPSRACAVPPPSQALIDNHILLQADGDDGFDLEDVEEEIDTVENALAGIAKKQLKKRASPFIISTYFHVVSTKSNSNMVTRDMISNQYGELQSAYANSSISFNLVNTSYTVNDTWATDQNDMDMKNALRKGTYASLNIYFQTNLSSSPGTSSASQLLGYCTLPTNVTYTPCNGCAPREFPTYAYANDGCNIHAASMPGGSLTGYNLGKTAVHEVGHWFGLLHTFQDNTCSTSDAGDYISDTPQESVSTDGCPATKDSCPGSPGLDPIHNFMDYSTDYCYTSFTGNQTARMQSMFKTMRQGL
ncbi:hypothetical protein MMC25_000909 [Agyrium rufum]|nr:hypothetical protein [Agyrium rufum]